MSDIESSSLSGAAVGARLETGPDDHLVGKVEAFEFPMDPEAQALVVLASRAVFDQVDDFAVAAFDRLIAMRGIERGLLVASVRDAEWPVLSAEHLGEIFAHVDYNFPHDLTTAMSGEFDTGWILDDTWDLKSVIYATDNDLVGLFWVTYV